MEGFAIFTLTKVKINTIKRSITHHIPAYLIALVGIFSAFSGVTKEKESVSMPLYTPNPQTLEYLGGFRLPKSKKGVSRLGYAQGIFALRPIKNSFFIIGHTHHQAIAELTIPELSLSEDISQWPMAKFEQPFSNIFPRVKNGNPDNINRITGMAVIEQQLVVNGMEYYDGGADANNTTLIIRQIDDLNKSLIDGFFSLQGAAHAAGWISKIPEHWQRALNSEYLVGNASTYPINARSSIGPTAFGVQLWGILNGKESSGLILTDRYMDFNIKQPIQPDQYNKKRDNDLWTEESRAYYGFIIPKTSSYFVIGDSGGHKSGIGYKITQDNGRKCPGPCAFSARDIYNYFWLFDVNDFVAVKAGLKQPHQIRPYKYGIFDKRYTRSDLIAAAYEESSQKLFVLYGNEDRSQSKYEKAPIMRVYKVNPEQQTSLEQRVTK